ncbi:MAG TPA: integrase core domain-containing protein [Sedimentisphaerales bacterium]|nr:integrase core domain-containing protein [Sedimentisphaerales bacterium]
MKSRFLIDLRVGPRTLEMTVALVTSVAACCLRFLKYPLVLVDDYAPYRTAILQVFGQIQYRRRRRRHGRKCQPGLKPPPGLLVGIVRKVRDDSGNLVKVSRKAFAGTVKQIEARIRELGIGTRINTSYIERLNGTLRGQQARLTRRTQNGSRRSDLLQKGLHIWRDLYNWIRVHGSLEGRTPAMTLGLADHVWSVVEYVCHPVHVSDLQRDLWAEERNAVQESALDAYKRRKVLPTS